jgi:hypothetical protein
MGHMKVAKALDMPGTQACFFGKFPQSKLCWI